jgi:chitodextrinase/predicted phosphodiesterase
MLSKKGMFNVINTVVLILVLLNSVAVYGQFRFVAYGDSRTNPGPANDIVGGISTQNPELVIHSGDLWDDYTSSEWKSFITARSNLDALLNANKYLVARGNHEGTSEVLNFSPSIVRNNSLKYYFTEGNCFFVCSEYDPDASFIESALQTSEAQSADWRLLWFHVPIYSAGGHTASGNAAIESLCDQYNVTMTFSGHSHIYERTHLLYNGQVVDTGDDIPAESQGTIYIVTGGGGAPLHGITSGWWVNTQQSVYHYMVLDAYPDRCEVTVRDINGTVIDMFVRRSVPPDPDAPVVSITNPLPGTVYNVPQAITISADATDPTPGGYITKVDFYVNDILIDTDTNSPYETGYTFPDFGTYTIKAVATDDQDKTGSATSTVYVRRINIALNKPVTSVTPWSNDPALNPLINDGDMGTRWSSLWEPDQYVYIDLEQEYSIDRVVLYWETACGQEYKIQVSSDAVNWADVFHETAGDGGMDEITFPAATGRYVKMWGIVPATVWGFSIWEMQINESLGPVEIPAAPSNLSAAAISSFQIDLSWTDNSDNEIGFKVERSLNGTSGWAEIGTTNANMTAFSDTSLNPETTYYYRVCASNSAGDSDYSNTASATTQGISLPAAPDNLSASAISSSKIDLSWTDNSDNETSFKVERSPDGASGWVEIGTANTNETTFSDTGLNPETTYYYRVCASNSAGDSGYSNTANATTQSAGSCTSPAWDPNATYNKGDVVSYVGNDWLWKSKTPGNLEPGTNKRFWRDLGHCAMGKTLISEEGQLPGHFSLHQNYPNPFNPVTHIRYDLSEEIFVTLKIYSIRGEEVETLVRTIQPAGFYDLTFNGSDLNSGVYIIRIQAGSYKQTKKMILMK